MPPIFSYLGITVDFMCSGTLLASAQSWLPLQQIQYRCCSCCCSSSKADDLTRPEQGSANRQNEKAAELENPGFDYKIWCKLQIFKNILCHGLCSCFVLGTLWEDDLKMPCLRQALTNSSPTMVHSTSLKFDTRINSCIIFRLNLSCLGLFSCCDIN